MNGLNTMKLENVIAARKDNGRKWPYFDLSVVFITMTNYDHFSLISWYITFSSGLYFRMAPVADRHEVWGEGWGGGVDSKSKIVCSGIY